VGPDLATASFWECPYHGAFTLHRIKRPVVVTVTIEISIKSGKGKTAGT
jgi:hypothetical protein